MLHPGIGGDDEATGGPRAQPDQNGREPMQRPADDPLAEQEDAEKRRLEEEGKGTFHGQGLRDDRAGPGREARPVGAELELHRDAGHHAHDEGDGKDARPEARRRVVALLAPDEVEGFQEHENECQAHGELGEEVMVGQGKGELQP
jgi:hypothetical protein